MTDSIDYYVILGISREAQVEEVHEAYMREMRIWRKRAAAFSENSIRDEAIRRLDLLSEAASILSDTQQRDAYIRQLTTRAVMSSPNPATASFRNWDEQARYYLAMADYYKVAGLAREVIAKQGDSAEAWSLLSRANTGLRRLNDAIYEARRAIELEPTNALYHFNLGTIYEELGHWDEAAAMYEQAAQREPGQLLYYLAIGTVWLVADQPTRAMPLIEQAYSTLPDDETTCFYYTQALIDMAESAPQHKEGVEYFITSPKEIQQMRSYLSRATNIKHLDQLTKQTIHEIETHLQHMEGKTFHIPLGARRAFVELTDPTKEGGCVGSLMGIVMFIGLALLPLLLLFWSFALLTGGSIGTGFIVLLISAGSGYLWYWQTWIPRWKVNARIQNG